MTYQSNTKDLQTTLQDLVSICSSSNGKPVELELTVPQTVLDSLSLYYRAKERTPAVATPVGSIGTLHFNEGTVRLKAREENKPLTF